MKFYISILCPFFFFLSSFTYASSVQLPVFIKECNNCSELAREHKASTVRQNAKVVVIDTVNTLVHAYNVKMERSEPGFLVGIPTSISVPHDVQSAASDFVFAKNDYKNDFAARHPNFQVLMQGIENSSNSDNLTTSSESSTLNNISTSNANEDGSAFEFMANSGYRRTAYSILIGTDNKFRIGTSKRSILVDKVSVGFDAKFVSGGADLKVAEEPIDLTWPDGTKVRVEANEKKQNFDIVFAVDASGNDIAVPGSNVIVGAYNFNNANDALAFQNYIESYWPADIFGNWRSPSCAMRCSWGVERLSCTYSCR